MRKLIVLAVVMTTLYGGYWFIGRSQIETRMTTALADIDAGDVGVSYDTLRTIGFPSRFDTTITDLVLDVPASRIAWAAETFQLFALSYRPNEIIAVFPKEQTLTVDGEAFTILSDDMRASGKVRANVALAFQAATIEITQPRILTEEGAELAMASLLAAMRLTPETTRTYDVFFEADAIALPDSVRRMIDPQRQQPDTIQNLRLDSKVDLSAPITLLGDTTTPIGLDGLRISEMSVQWGDMSLTAIGDLTPDDAGLLNGSISLVARNWEQAVDLAVSTGTIKGERRFLVMEIANNMDETPHISDTLTLTLSVTNGNMMLGAFPLGSAPAFLR